MFSAAKILHDNAELQRAMAPLLSGEFNNMSRSDQELVLKHFDGIVQGLITKSKFHHALNVMSRAFGVIFQTALFFFKDDIKRIVQTLLSPSSVNILYMSVWTNGFTIQALQKALGRIGLFESAKNISFGQWFSNAADVALRYVPFGGMRFFNGAGPNDKAERIPCAMCHYCKPEYLAWFV